MGPTGLKLSVAYEVTEQYRLGFNFYGIAKRGVPKIVGKEMDTAVERAVSGSSCGGSMRRFRFIR